MKVKSEIEVTQSCLTLSNPHGLQPTRLLHPWDFPGKSTGVGCRYKCPENLLLNHFIDEEESLLTFTDLALSWDGGSKYCHYRHSMRKLRLVKVR